MNTLKKIAKFPLKFAVHSKFFFGRAVLKPSKIKVKDEETKIAKTTAKIQLTSSQEKFTNARIFKDLQKVEENQDFEDNLVPTSSKSSLKIETFPDLLSEEDIFKSLQKLTPTIDQIFVNELHETGHINEQKWQKLKKKLRILPSSSLVKIAKTVSDFPKYNRADSVWMPLEDEFSARLHKMSFDEIVRMLWCFAYANRKNREFFRKIENELYDREWKYAHISHIGKMLWAFSYADLGSAELYSKIAETIKVVQYEIPPIKLAEYANYFSKSSENIQGGFGVYKIAEKRLLETLNDYDFHEAVKIAGLLIPQNIGSNEFYRRLEEKILETFPNKEEISLPDLVKLSKAMALFRYQNNSLKDRIENNVLKYAEFMSNSQIEDTLWAFSRGKKGSKTLYDKLEQEFVKRVNLFKPRSLAFAYFGFASTRNGSSNFYEVFHKRIGEKINDFNTHCLIKMLRGMQIMNVNEIRDMLIAKMLHSKKLKVTEMIKLLMIINESNIQISKENSELYNEIFNHLMMQFNESLSLLKMEEKCQIFYSYILHNKFTEKTFQIVIEEIPDANTIPKSIFCQTLWAMIQSKNFDFAKEFIPIANNLRSFGDIKFFFDHDNFIKLSWSLILLNFNSGMENNSYYTIDKPIWQTIKEAILNINPNTLKAIENVGLWLQTLGLLNTVVEVTEEEIKHKISEINEFTKKTLASSSKLNLNDLSKETIREEIVNLIEKIVSENPIKNIEIELFKGFYDDFFNFIDIALIWGKKPTQKMGIRIRNKRDYLFEDNENTNFYLMKNEMNDRILENVFGWKICTIVEEEFSQKGDNEKKLLISRFLKKIH